MKNKYICQPLNAEGGFDKGGNTGKDTYDEALKWAQNHLAMTLGCTRVAIYKVEGTLERDPPPMTFKKLEQAA